MLDPIQLLCQLDSVEQIRKDARVLKVKILSERTTTFIDGTSKIQLTVEVDGIRGFLVPASEGARARQAAAGRYLKPYNFVIS